MQSNQGPLGAQGPQQSGPTGPDNTPEPSGGRNGEELPSRPAIEVFSDTITAYQGGGNPDTEDALFAVHHMLVRLFRAGKVRSASVAALWNDMQPIVEAAEKRIGKEIHKGAPLYNTGLSLFLDGDFDGAYYFINRAAREDERIGRNSYPGILVGDHELSKQIILDPLVRDLCPIWQADYAASIGTTLDAAELKSVLMWLAKRPSDAFTVVAALHRLQRLLKREPNDAVRLSTVRATADLLIAMESSLRRMQGPGNRVGEQLGKRLPPVIALNPRADSSFVSLRKWWNATYDNAQMESEIGVNGLLAEAIQRFTAAANPAERAGIVAFTTFRLRNSVLHVNEENLTIFKDHALGLRMAGWAFMACRVVKHAEDASFATLP